MEPIKRKCLLHTLEGVFEAIAVNTKELTHGKGYPLTRINTLDGKYSMLVYRALSVDKFESSNKPTFFNC